MTHCFSMSGDMDSLLYKFPANLLCVILRKGYFSNVKEIKSLQDILLERGATKDDFNNSDYICAFLGMTVEKRNLVMAGLHLDYHAELKSKCNKFVLELGVSVPSTGGWCCIDDAVTEVQAQASRVLAEPAALVDAVPSEPAALVDAVPSEPAALVDAVRSHVAVKRGRGRPKGSKNKIVDPPASSAGTKRGRGRPKGSKNKILYPPASCAGTKRGRGRPKGSKSVINKAPGPESAVKLLKQRIPKFSIASHVVQRMRESKKRSASDVRSTTPCSPARKKVKTSLNVAVPVREKPAEKTLDPLAPGITASEMIRFFMGGEVDFTNKEGQIVKLFDITARKCPDIDYMDIVLAALVFADICNTPISRRDGRVAKLAEELDFSVLTFGLLRLRRYFDVQMLLDAFSDEAKTYVQKLIEGREYLEHFFTLQDDERDKELRVMHETVYYAANVLGRGFKKPENHVTDGFSDVDPQGKIYRCIQAFRGNEEGCEGLKNVRKSVAKDAVQNLISTKYSFEWFIEGKYGLKHPRFAAMLGLMDDAEHFSVPTCTWRTPRWPQQGVVLGSDVSDPPYGKMTGELSEEAFDDAVEELFEDSLEKWIQEEMDFQETLHDVVYALCGFKSNPLP